MTMNIPELESDWRSAGESSTGTMAGSGSNPRREKDPLSSSHCQSEQKGEDRPEILIVEDNPADVYLIRRAIEAANLSAGLEVIRDGEQAIRFLDEVDNDAKPCPDLIILDINLPRKPGADVLQHMRQTKKCSKTLVVVVSTSEAPKDLDAMMKLGASCYFHKPSAYADFMKLGDIVKELLEGEALAS